MPCTHCRLGTVEKLCEFAAPQKVANVHGKTPLDLCLTEGARDILNSLGGFGHEVSHAPK